MSKELNFEANDQTIEDALFQNYVYKIPRYQRPYAWTEDEVSEFWNDLQEENGPMFIGSFIFNRGTLETEGYLEVVDGQQRILTITILFAVIRDLAKGIDAGLANYYHTRRIVVEGDYQKWTPRIVCGDSTNPFFSKYIQSTNENILEAVTSSDEEKLIKNNYIFFKDKISNELKNFESAEKRIEYIKNLVKRIGDIIVIYIKIAREEDAYEIFETTNARGVDLNVADLLKNWIFKNKRIENFRDLAKEVWQDIENNVQGDMRRFLRYQWVSRHPFVTERKLYKSIKNTIIDWDKYLNDLWSSSDTYNMLIHPSEEQWMSSEYKHQARLYKSVLALRLMGISQCYVFLMSILDNYQKLKTDPVKVFESIEKFSFQYSVVAKQPGNKVEKIYSSYALKLHQIVNEDLTDESTPVKVHQLFQQLENDLKSNLPPRDLFLKGFDGIKYKTTDQGRLLVKYVLSEINNYWQPTNEFKIDYNNVNIEHIIPQNPDKSWGLSKTEIKGYVNNLGNLTLLDKTLNSKAGNKSFIQKIDLLRDSQLPITKKLIAEFDAGDKEWNEEKVLQRQTELAKLAYDKVWKF
ncbi:MAG: DUF262 domain-containing protein [Crenarchaeota archaeon]|nr:DUF262 domain-containing protein [Thermoproteota archaeon]